MTKILFLNGPPRSGKDTIAQYISETYKNIIHVKMANHLKNIAHILAGLTDIEIDYFEDCKDYASVQLPYKVDKGDFYTPREWYMHVAENIIKPSLGDDYFGRMLLKTILKEEGKHFRSQLFVVSDSGFLCEAEPIIAHQNGEDCYNIQIRRDGYNFNHDSRSYWSHPQVSEYHIDNSSEIPYLENRIDELMTLIGKGHL